MEEQWIKGQGYIAMRDALRASAEDEKALSAVLAAAGGREARWITTAHEELRQHLANGSLKEAEALGNLIATVLERCRKGDANRLQEVRIHREAMRWVTEGIRAVHTLDHSTGIKTLTELAESPEVDASLRWIAWLWATRAALDEGNLTLAKYASSSAMELTRMLDLRAEAVTLCAIGRTNFLVGEIEAALQHLSNATGTFEILGDRRGMATTLLTKAKILVNVKRELEGIQAARLAQKASLDWEEPAVFLSQRALIADKVDEAHAVLFRFYNITPRSPEVDRQRQLIEQVRGGVFPREVVAEYLLLKEQPPGAKTLQALAALCGRAPEFYAPREMLAWDLLRMGQDEEAINHFRALLAFKLDPEMRSSVLLGLGCLASRKYRSGQPAARMWASVLAELRDRERPAGVQGADLAARRGEHVSLGEVVETLDPGEAEAAEKEFEGGRTTVRLAQDDEAIRLAGESGSAVDLNGRATVAFSGELHLLPLADLLDYLSSTSRTGFLVITLGNRIGAIHLCDGKLTGAATLDAVNMGDLLVQKGVISAEQLRAAVEFQRVHNPDRLLGSILVEQAKIDPAAVRESLEQQIKSALHEMLGWPTGRFAFRAERLTRDLATEGIPLEMDTRRVLLEVLELDADVVEQ